MIMQYAWPGNVRELENAMERAVVLGVSDWVLPEDLPETLLEAAPRDAGAKYHQSVGDAKCEVILDAYAQANGDYKQAAKLLGLHPNTLKIRAHRARARLRLHFADVSEPPAVAGHWISEFGIRIAD